MAADASSPSDRHVIRKAFLEVHAGASGGGISGSPASGPGLGAAGGAKGRWAAGAGDALRFQQEAAAWARDRLLPELEELFAALPATEDHVVLDRLEIEVESGDAAQWGTEVLPRLKADLAAALRRKLDAGGREKGEARLGAAEAFLAKLSVYLEHGVLPWNFAVAAPGELAAEAGAWADRADARPLAPDLSVTWKSPQARLRFLRSLPEPVIARILVRLFGMPEAMPRAWARDAARVLALIGDGTAPSPVPSVTPELPLPLLEEILTALAHNPRLFAHGLEEEIVQGFLLRLGAGDTLASRERKSIAWESQAFAIAWDRIGKRSPAPKRDSETRPSVAGTPGSRVAVPGDAVPAAPLSPRGEPESVDSAGPASRAPAQDPALEGIHIAHAGLILAAPFLGMLFERVELSRGSELRDPATALALLHYLATGEEGPAEFQVALGKVLCGVPLEQAFDLPATLPAALKAEADQLSESLIEHWSILKSTSVAGLREAFLQRPGRLSRRKDGEWLLQVEQRAHDMLLQHLPWSFQWVRLPWMPNVLRTEWVE